ncbi:glycosyltransferase [Hymenobacter profundi]|uniref:Glycosyltransferase family 2 protein n=1 Tax=Hymenobacter profundi TaxID=1982110 RepID=A0ABS6WXT7_9BACT|nr:glycosyltransferase [Hymenobacter profundi]MBW3127588.1 glycosyltransferase family 2 protein [Hymenobacter profundi]
MMHTNPVGVSVLVCTYNGGARITETLSHLARQKVALGLQWEVILVDNASTDNTLAVATDYWVSSAAPAPLRTYVQPKPGKNYALELAYDEASYSYMCIVDDDNWLAPDYVQNGFDILQSHPEIGLLGGKTAGAFEVEPPAWFKQYQHYYAVGAPVLYDGNIPRPIDDGPVVGFELWGAGLFVRRSIWEEMTALRFESLLSGRKGKDLVAGEDHELSYIARLLGYTVWYSSSLSLTHFMTKSRLTAAYRDQLLHACAIGSLQLLPYKYALLNKKEEPNITLDVLKDFYYIEFFTVKNIFSANYLGFLFGKEKTSFIINNVHVKYIYKFFLNIKNITENYKKVIGFKRRVIAYRVSQESLANRLEIKEA